jgi:hypothetical protein
MPNLKKFLRVTHPFAARHQVLLAIYVTARLACVKPAASVHPEPGSNSQQKEDLQKSQQIWSKKDCF